MSNDEKMTGDLFEVDKRLSLKPVVDFNAFLRAAFASGPCTCCRCVASGGDETGYEHTHTFDFEGRPINRRFACTADSDVAQALKKAWLSYTKAELPTSGALDLATIKDFVEPQLHKRLVPLFTASGWIKEVNAELQIQA